MWERIGRNGLRGMQTRKTAGKTGAWLNIGDVCQFAFNGELLRAVQCTNGAERMAFLRAACAEAVTLYKRETREQ
jgi:hypothetical protein